MVAFHVHRWAAGTGSTRMGRRADKGPVISGAGKGAAASTSRLLGGQMRPFAGNRIIPRSASRSNSCRQAASFSRPLGAFQGRISHRVAVSSIRLKWRNCCTVLLSKAISSLAESLSPIQKGGSNLERDKAAHLPSSPWPTEPKLS